MHVCSYATKPQPIRLYHNHYRTRSLIVNIKMDGSLLLLPKKTLMKTTFIESISLQLSLRDLPSCENNKAMFPESIRGVDFPSRRNSFVLLGQLDTNFQACYSNFDLPPGRLNEQDIL
jgi:hypothetical protein